MQDQAAFDEFVGLVKRNLEKNGFPENAVSLPMERMYEEASRRGFSFNKVRDALKAEGIASESEAASGRIVFRRQEEAPVTSGGAVPDLGAEGSPFGESPDVFAAAQEILGRMSDEERENLVRMVQNMDPETLRSMQEQWEKMPDAEKARMMAQMNKP